DGTVESITEYEYDSEGNQTRYMFDKNADGQFDSVSTYTYESGLVSSFTEDNNNDGIPNIIIAYSYDAQGNRQSHQVNVSGSGIPISLGSFTYDSMHNLVRYEQYNDNDGISDYIESFSYDQQQRRTFYRRDTDGDGRWNSVTQYKYD